MNIKWKGVILGIVVSLIIAVIVISALSYLQSPAWLYYLVYIGFFFGGVIAMYIAKLKTLKNTILIGSSVGITSFILYYIGIIIFVDLLIPLIYASQSNSNLPTPHAFLMAGIVKGNEPTIIDQLQMAWGVVLYGILLSAFSLLGSYSFYLILSFKKKETLKKGEIFGYMFLIILLFAMLLSSNYYLLSALAITLILFIVAFIFVQRREVISR